MITFQYVRSMIQGMARGLEANAVTFSHKWTKKINF